MLSLRQSLARVLSFFRKQQHDADLETELSHHLELAIEENIASGLTPEEARRSALLRFGNVQQAREYQRATRGLPWIDVLMQDFRLALRTLRRDHTFALIAVLILALGIGANVVVFSVVNTILLRPLPFPQAQQLVRIVPKTSKCGESCNTYSTDAVQELQRRTQVFSGVTGYDAFTSPGNWKHSVTQRTQEIGIRMALGATRVSVQLAVIRQTLRMAAIGILLGAVASLGVSSLIASLLFGTAPSDPLTFLAIATLLAIVAVLAGYIPARRASGINPMVALRNN